MKSEKNGSKKKKVIFFSILGALVLLVAVIVATKSGGEKIIKVKTEKVTRRDITQTVSATGSINPINSVVITPEVTGEIVELPVQEGDKVKKGDLLIRIKPDIYIAQRNRARASLEAARANLSISKAKLEQVKAEYERVKKLYEKNLASKQELEIAKANYLSSEGQYKAQVSAVKQAEESLAEKEEDLAKTAIYSPLTGTVSKLNVELGERVLGSGFTQGTNLMTVSNLKDMEAVVEVDENDVVLVSEGDTAKINIDAFGDEEFYGVVYQIGNSAKQTGVGTQDQVVNFEIKIRLLGKNKKIKPGMSCDAEIRTETHNNVLAIPIQALTARIPKKDNKKFKDKKGERKPNMKKPKDFKKKKPREVVFLFDNGKAKMQFVKTGISDDDYIEITEGLNEGDEIISGPYKAVSRELEDGSKVIKEKENKDKSNAEEK